MSENEFPKGIMIRKPKDNAPDFIRGQISLKLDEAIPYLQSKASFNNWLNIDIKISKQGSMYLAVNNYKKQSGYPSGDNSGASQNAGNMTNQDFANEGFEQVNDNVPF
jgi:hypothetical protein